MPTEKHLQRLSGSLRNRLKLTLPGLVVPLQRKVVAFTLLVHSMAFLVTVLPLTSTSMRGDGS
jgi:hypothetical protein|eukprot:COSAG02_NODE_1043_length_15014_cov_8.766007_2_plen_63_part_00